MENQELLAILKDWNFWKKDLNVGIPRLAYLEKLQALKKLEEIVVVKGIRRSGKSTILLQYCQKLITEQILRREDILIVNFEDPRLRNLNLELLNQIYELYLTELNPQEKHVVILDEVQNVDGWERFARYLHENKKVEIFVTGSSSKLLSSEYATVLTGRHVDLEVFPLSFTEFLAFQGISVGNLLEATAKRHQIKQMTARYLAEGGFPKVAITASNEGKRELLVNYVQDILIKDIVVRYGIKEISKMEELTKYFLTNISTLQSFNKTKNALGLTLDTVERFSHYLNSAYLLFFIPKFSYSKKEQLLNPRKVYCIDSGMRNAVAFLFSKDLGRLAENVVFLNLKKKFPEIFYWKDASQLEVDFLVRDRKKLVQAIQVCWNAEEKETKARETKALLRALKEHKLKQGTIITESHARTEKIEGKIIKYVPLWQWLLEI